MVLVGLKKHQNWMSDGFSPENDQQYMMRSWEPRSFWRNLSIFKWDPLLTRWPSWAENEKQLSAGSSFGVYRLRHFLAVGFNIYIYNMYIYIYSYIYI